MSNIMPLYGCRLLEITPLDPDSDFAPEVDAEHLLEVPQEAGVEPDIMEGARDELRGGDRLVAIIEDEDYMVGLDITFNNAALDAEAIQILAGGGELITEGETDDVVGYESPTIEDQHDGRAPFQAKLYVAQYAEGFSEREEIQGYIEFTFPYCKGQIPSVSAAGQTFMVPSFTIEAREHKHSDPTQGAFKFEEVEVGDLPE